VQNDCRRSALLTDLYELTMAAAFFESGIEANATFELFVRSLPANRGYLIAAGLEHALQFIEHLHFTADELAFVRSVPAFAHIAQRFFDFLEDLRFHGEVWAMPEGTPFFANEPVLRVSAPIIQAQLLETYLLSTLTFQSMIATKAARCVRAAGGKPVVDFGARRAHGPEAGLLAARAAYIGGCAGTSNVEAGKRFGIPLFGTLAHSFIMAHQDEAKAFCDFTAAFPESSILLLDTYDTLRAVEKIVRSGILAVNWGQTEAALALGLTRGQVLRMIVLPQSLRIIVPPVTSQYLNLTKNSSLAVAIGYPDLVSVANTTINQTGQAIEGVAVIMAVYLTISLSIALFMNWYNKRIALVER